jgi:hypothetical protein
MWGEPAVPPLANRSQAEAQVALFRAFGVERCMKPPLVVD